MRMLSFLPRFDASSRAHLATVARACGSDYKEHLTTETLVADLDAHDKRKALLLLDTTDPELICRIHESSPNALFILIIEEDIKQLDIRLRKRLPVQSFITVASPSLSGINFGAILQKARSGEIFGIERYLRFGTEVFRDEITSSEDSRVVLNDLSRYINWLAKGDKHGAPVMEEYARRICSIADELILNAVFSANHRFYNIDHKSDYTLEPHERITVQWGFDDGVFALSVEDRFGLLSRDTVLSYLDQTMSCEDIATRHSGGFGLRLVFGRVHQFIVNVLAGTRTEIVCLMKFEKRIRDYDLAPKSFHYFSL